MPSGTNCPTELEFAALYRTHQKWSHPIMRPHAGQRRGLYRLVSILALVASAATLTPAHAAVAPTSPPTSIPTSAAAAPISIADGCSYKTVNSGMGFGGSVTINGKGYNFFEVTFTNNAAVAADKIVFQIDFGKASRIVIPDAGTFAPGSTVKQTLRDRGKEMVFSARPTPNDGSVICTVLSAHFVDGTSYTSPASADASPAP